MESTRDLAAVIGLGGRLRITPDRSKRVEGLCVDVIIEDARRVYGRIDYRVTPLSGDGAMWVHSDRVALEVR